VLLKEMGAAASTEIGGERFSRDVMPLKSLLNREKQARDGPKCRAPRHSASRYHIVEQVRMKIFRVQPDYVRPLAPASPYSSREDNCPRDVSGEQKAKT
jgi:hypothetical protein